MAIFNDSSPANEEAAKLGAQRLREMKTSLNSMLSQIFDDAFAFLPNWVVGAQIRSHASDDSLRAIGANHLKDNAVLLRTILDGIFTADAGGRAKFAAGFVNGALLDPAIELPAGIVDTDDFAVGAVDTNALGNLAATIAKVGAGVAKIAIGTFAGSDSASATVSGLAFAPDFVILVGGSTSNRIGVAFRNESTASVGPIHSLWDSGTIGAPNTTALQWTADGFIVVPFNYNFNDAGKTHSYIAFKV